MAKTQNYSLRSTGPAPGTTQPPPNTTDLDLEVPTPPSPANTSVSSMSATSTESPKSVVAHKKSKSVKLKSKRYSLPENISSSSPLPKLFALRTKSPNVTLTYVSQGMYIKAFMKHNVLLKLQALFAYHYFDSHCFHMSFSPYQENQMVMLPMIILKGSIMRHQQDKLN